MRDIIFNRAIIFYIIVVLAAVFMWVNYVNTPYLLLAVSIGAIFLLLEMEIFLFYIFCVVFWVPISISYGPLNAVVDGASISEVCIYIGIVGLVLKNVIAGKWKDVLSRIFKMPFLLPIVMLPRTVNSFWKDLLPTLSVTMCLPRGDCGTWKVMGWQPILVTLPCLMS